jgi:pimeloyl-ACP methyl ester carboxylesterase
MQELDSGPAAPASSDPVARLLEGMPVAERRLDVSGVSTAVIEGGDGPPIVLLHGQGGFAAMWVPVMRELVGGHRVVAPDLPGLGRSEVRTASLDASGMATWLSGLIAQTCDERPIVVGHSLGGSLGAHFALAHGERLRGLVLVDSGSLGRFRPSPRMLLALIRFVKEPSPATHHGFLSQVFVDPDRARVIWGDRWDAFESFHIYLARQPSVATANRELLRRIGIRRIPRDRLREIRVPVDLIWGRDDPVMRFRIAESASADMGWPLHPIDDSGHVPHVEQPAKFFEALEAATSGM